MCARLLFLCAVTSPSWSMTDDINNAGGFCADPSSTDCTGNRNAHFGIWYLPGAVKKQIDGGLFS